MSNYAETKKDVLNFLRARVPLIVVKTSERERVERMMLEVKNELNAQIHYYTDVKQVTEIGSQATVADTENDPLAYIAALFRKKRGAIFVFGDVRKVGEDTIYTRELINVLYLAMESASTLILITPDAVMQRIARFGMVTKLDYPDLSEREAQIKKFIRVYAGRFPVEWTEEDVLHAATLLRGFTEIQIENILSDEIVSEGGLRRENLYHLTGQKDRLYAEAAAVSAVKVDRDLQVSGLQNLARWLAEKKKVFFASDAELSSYALQPPKGILLAGVPGCGKSFSAKVIAREWELPLYRFDIGTVYDKWMGESERKMSEALEYIDNVSPCILWIDEIEKGLAVSDGGNDTSRRILGQFLFWLQESASRVFLVATANDVTALPPELFRKGRFSEIFFTDLPSDEERAQAIVKYAKRCLHVGFSPEELKTLTDLSKGFSFSEIEYAIKEEAQQLLIGPGSGFSIERLEGIMRTVIPIEKRDPEAVRRIIAWGRQCALPANQIKGGKDIG